MDFVWQSSREMDSLFVDVRTNVGVAHLVKMNRADGMSSRNALSFLMFDSIAASACPISLSCMSLYNICLHTSVEMYVTSARIVFCSSFQ